MYYLSGNGYDTWELEILERGQFRPVKVFTAAQEIEHFGKPEREISQFVATLDPARCLDKSGKLQRDVAYILAKARAQHQKKLLMKANANG